MRHWIARLSFTFFILAFLLGLKAVHLAERHLASDRPIIILCWVGCFLSLCFAWYGVRERHRSTHDDETP